MNEGDSEERRFFHIGENYYTTMSVDEPDEGFALRFREMKTLLVKRFYRATRRHKIEPPANLNQIEMLPAKKEKSILLWSWCSGRWATAVLICALLGAMPLLYSCRVELGELLIQIGERLDVEPAVQTIVLPPPLPMPLPQATSQRPAESPAQSLTPPLPRNERFSPPLKEAAAPFQPHVDSEAHTAETPSASWTTSLPLSPMAPVPNLTSREPIDSVEPEAANFSARDIRDLPTPYINSSAGKYFDIGKFGNMPRANDAIDKLGQFGFHAIIVHSRFLWMNAYHVLVGPYTSQEEAETARYRLQSRGVTPQVPRTKSRHFSLPTMTLYGTDLTVKDCIVTWELNSPDATVEFMKGKNILATSKGRWEKRDFALKNDAIVSRENERGPETLLEIQGAGMDRGLVIDGSVVRVYLSTQ